jgi:hypothetical protein
VLTVMCANISAAVTDNFEKLFKMRYKFNKLIGQ